MFRDLKEYQEIAKIYSEKVSKPAEVESNELVENQENRRKLTQQRQQQNAGRAEKQFSVLKPKPIQGRVSRSSQNMSGKPKPMPTTAEIRAKDDASGGSGMSNIPSKEGNAVIDGKKLNPDFGKKVDIKKEFPDKASEVETKTEVKKPKMGSPGSKYIKKDKGVGFVKRGTPMAQRAENKEKNKMRAQEMAKARIAAKKKAEAEMSNEEFTPYDLVLEYLLSTEQAATIEEANYVMTEMDAETIQGIVEAQKKTLDVMDMMKMPVVNVLGGIGSAIAGTVAAARYLGRKAGERGIKKQGEKPGKPGLIKTIKDRTDATNKAIKEIP